MGTVLVYSQQNPLPRRPLLHKPSQNQNLPLKTQPFPPKTRICPHKPGLFPPNAKTFPKPRNFSFKKISRVFHTSPLLFLQIQHSFPSKSRFFLLQINNNPNLSLQNLNFLLIPRFFPYKSRIFPNFSSQIQALFPKSRAKHSEFINSSNSLIFLPTRGSKETPNSTFPLFFSPKS